MVWFLFGLGLGMTIVGAPLGYFVYRSRRHLWEHIKEYHMQ
ncbi:MAG: hypothetical protein QMD05_09495 [Candidatus Brocadiaceae bacterium]|nr:hypothetical protein [Candidatus Brocadiaceae bacterium]